MSMSSKGRKTLQNKVTSYEISKRLAELGYNGDSHCGWWVYCRALEEWTHIPLYDKDRCQDQLLDIDYIAVKSYDCWDLLMWLSDYKTLKKIAHRVFLGIFQTGKFQTERFELDFWNWSVTNNQPQNALGLAVIKILEERG